MMMNNFFSPWYSSPVTSFMPFFIFFPALILILALWSIAIKGFALWHAARNGQKEWFIGLLIINTVGILELVYLIWYCPSKSLAHPAKASTASQTAASGVSSDSHTP